MDQSQLIASLQNMQAKYKKLVEENDRLKWMLSLVKENQDLRGRITFNDNALEDSTGTKLNGLMQTFDEQNFRQNLEQCNVKRDHRTSSPVDFQTFLQTSMYTFAEDKAEVPSCQPGPSACLGTQVKLLGEIVYQLDRRILSFVFQGHRRIFGFTLFNIPQKILEVSTHPLTGKVDEGYRRHLIQRHADLMLQLNKLGYKAALHPAFIEFMINTYGILPDKNRHQETDYNNPEFLKKVIIESAPKNLQKDLQLLLTCLCYMAENDGKPLLLW